MNGPGPGPRPKFAPGPGPGVVYIQTAVFYNSLHIHHQIVHTSHFPIFSRPKPGGGINVTIRVRNRRFELKLGPNRSVSVQIT